MDQITNDKVAGLEPLWEPFAGFSLLFDNPGFDHRPVSGASLLEVSPTPGGSLDLYARLAQALDELEKDDLVGQYQFCPLPKSSYHVTAWDGINRSNLDSIPQAMRRNWEDFLLDIPKSLATPPAAMNIVSCSRLANWRSSISFSFSTLALRNNLALVAELRPKGPDSDAAFEALLDERTALSDEATASMNLPFATNFCPHVSLGYFANEAGGQAAHSMMDQWNARFRQQTRNSHISFGSISLYGFTDMVHFYRGP